MTIPKIQNNVITFSSGKRYKMPEAHEDYCYEFNNLIFLILGDLEDIARNIWCFDQEGNKLWEIEPSSARYPYHLLDVDKQGRLYARDQTGANYAIELETGYIEFLGGDKYAGAEWPNTLIRQRREERLKTEK